MDNRPYCNNIVDEINQKIYSRSIAERNLDTLLSPRPQQTKYVLPLQSINTPCINPVVEYNTQPTTLLGSWRGFVTNINKESLLHNQIYANQKYPQKDFVPNSTSDLYNSTIPKSDDNTIEVKFPYLFNSNIIYPHSHDLGAYKLLHKQNLSNINMKLFNNDTRQQLKDR